MTGLLAHLLVCVAAATPAPSPVAPPSPSARLDKMARILALEDARSPGDGELERALADPDRGVRRRAALAAGRIGDGSLVPALLPRLADGEPEVRQMAAFALGLIADSRAKDALLAALKDPLAPGVASVASRSFPAASFMVAPFSANAAELK